MSVPTIAAYEIEQLEQNSIVKMFNVNNTYKSMMDNQFRVPFILVMIINQV